jgi:hypothetical protein
MFLSGFVSAARTLAGSLLLLTLVGGAQANGQTSVDPQGLAKAAPGTGVPPAIQTPPARQSEVGHAQPELRVVPECSVKVGAGKQKREIAIGTTDWLQIGNPITVCVQGLTAWRKTPGNNPKNIRLFLAGHMVDGAPSLIAPDSQEYLNFEPQIGASSDDTKTWSYIIAESRASTEHKIPISIGSNDQPVESLSYATLHLYPRLQILIFIPVFLLMAAGFVYLARSSTLLRDTSFGAAPSVGQLPFSLGRVQMAWWFFIILTTFVYLWIVTGHIPTVSGQALALMGISATTGLGAVLIDSNKVSSEAMQVNSLTVEQSALANRIADLEALAPPLGTPLYTELQSKKDRLAQVTAELQARPNILVPVTKGFLHDLMSESGQISFNRFQIAAWTIVLGGIFVVSCYSSLIMPTFDSTLLLLLGISSGAYLGFKLPTAQTAP